MSAISHFAVKLLLSVLVVVALGYGQVRAGERLGTIITSTKDLTAYMKSEDYRKNKEVIRAELLRELQTMISSDQYHELYGYLPLIVDIADSRYIPLMRKIEGRAKGHSVVNLNGYSRLLEYKNSTSVDVSGATRALINAEVGAEFLNEALAFLQQEKRSHIGRLGVFELVVQHLGGSGMDRSTNAAVIYETLRRLCTENQTETDEFIKRSQVLHGTLAYTCATVEEAP